MRKKRKITFESLQGLFKTHGYNSVKMEGFLPYSRPTCQTRIKDPNRFTLGDMVSLLQKSAITPNELLDALRKDIGE